MAEKTRAEQAAEDRRRRSEEALKANLRRRKDQSRARKAADTAEADTDASTPPAPDEA